jgi:hypothetical protein
MRALKPLELLERSPWASALLAATGVTLGVPSALSLLLPVDLLDAAWTLGDRRLLLLLSGLFTATACAVRISLRRPPSLDDDLVDSPQAAPPVAGGHLR